jgi:hypothetical protein
MRRQLLRYQFLILSFVVYAGRIEQGRQADRWFLGGFPWQQAGPVPLSTPQPL